MKQRAFGTLPTGEAVTCFTLESSTGAVAEVLDYGGIVRALRVPNRDGNLTDVVLGFNHLEDYLGGHPYFGAITGRIAGRLKDGCFTIGDKHYHLHKNDGCNHLHGGAVGLDKRLWQAEAVPLAGGDALQLRYLSPNGEEGYPGNLQISVTYSLTANNEFIVQTEVETDEATPVNLTHHGYFNLGGENAGSIVDHHLQIHAHHYVPTDDDMSLREEAQSVVGCGNDFRALTRIGDALSGILNAHGDLYILSRDPDPQDGLRDVATLHDPASGRSMIVRSTDSCLQFYSGRFLDGTLRGKSKEPYGSHAGLCLEAQGHPNPNTELGVPSIIVQPEKTRRHTTIYAFTGNEPA